MLKLPAEIPNPVCYLRVSSLRKADPKVPFSRRVVHTRVELITKPTTSSRAASTITTLEEVKVVDTKATIATRALTTISLLMKKKISTQSGTISILRKRPETSSAEKSLRKSN